MEVKTPRAKRISMRKKRSSGSHRVALATRRLPLHYKTQVTGFVRPALVSEGQGLQTGSTLEMVVLH
ncbi:hypothetical protein EYF80_018325 [Liparis tanakae]|uniref:Uncharacterized protein n=1 Tax=Liparis tanakae TaxID=230148 RepID=A0A4Z2I100_9TELE|nr:hypothetical protein EYF80_018325 [Liparis tanakae]